VRAVGPTGGQPERQAAPGTAHSLARAASADIAFGVAIIASEAGDHGRKREIDSLRDVE
jgi:hypothetical protein